MKAKGKGYSARLARAALALLLSCAALSGCGKEQASPCPVQYDYLSADTTACGTIPPERLRHITLSLPASCRYTAQTYDDYMACLLAAYPKVSYITDRAAAAEDTLCFYYSVSCGEEMLLSCTAEDGEAAEIALGGADFLSLPGFNARLVAAVPGSTLSFSVTAPADHPIALLRGKTLSVAVLPVSVRVETVLSEPDADYILHTLGWQTDCSDPQAVVAAFEETVKAELQAAAEEEYSHALDSALLSYLLSVFTPTAYPEEDLNYNFSALYNYYDSLRTYESGIVTAYGNPADVPKTLGAYLARTYGLSSPVEGFAHLAQEARELTLANMAVAAAYHTLALSYTEAELAALTERVCAEDATAVRDPAYLRNLLLFEKVSDALLAPDNCTVLFDAPSD